MAGRLRKVIAQVVSRITNLMIGAQLTADFDALIRRGIVSVGRHSYGVPIVYTYPGCSCKLSIGHFVSIATGATFLLGGNHPTHWVSTFPFRARWRMVGAYTDGMPSCKGDIEVGNDVWIGQGAVILSGVKVGDGAVIAAGALVTRDVPPYAIVAGVPAKTVKLRFCAADIGELRRIAWWNWDEAQIRATVGLLSSGAVEEFIRLHANKNRQGSSSR